MSTSKPGHAERPSTIHKQCPHCERWFYPGCAFQNHKRSCGASSTDESSTEQSNSGDVLTPSMPENPDDDGSDDAEERFCPECDAELADTEDELDMALEQYGAVECPDCDSVIYNG